MLLTPFVKKLWKDLHILLFIMEKNVAAKKGVRYKKRLVVVELRSRVIFYYLT
jgi:hypothetical protein